jgi:hypothetical protein
VISCGGQSISSSVERIKRQKFGLDSPVDRREGASEDGFIPASLGDASLQVLEILAAALDDGRSIDNV